MPNPLPSDLHVNRFLTDISIAYIQKADRFIATQVFPLVPSAKQPDLYPVYDKGDWTRLAARKRAPGTESAGGGWDMSCGSFYCEVRAVHKDITDEDRANQDEPINMDRDATEWVTQQLLMERDQTFVTNYFGTGIWATDAVGGTDFTKWSESSSNPVLDIDNYKNAVASLTGYEPNVLVLSPGVFTALKNNDAVLERIKYTQQGKVTTDLLAGLFDLDKVLVPKGVINSGEEGGSDDLDFIFPEGALLVYAAPNPSKLQPSAGYCFSWSGLLGAGRDGNRIKTFRMEHLGSDRVEGEMAYDLKVVAADLGVFFSDPI